MIVRIPIIQIINVIAIMQHKPNNALMSVSFDFPPVDSLDT